MGEEGGTGAEGRTCWRFSSISSQDGLTILTTGDGVEALSVSHVILHPERMIFWNRMSLPDLL